MDLIDKGHRDRLSIANDICFKTLLTRFGGQGYAHVVGNVVPMLRDRGVDDATLDALLIDDPARLYAF